MTSLDIFIKGDSLSWEQVQARVKTAWELVPTGFQWRNGLIESRVKDLKVMLKYVLSRTLRGEELTLSYSNLCTLLAIVTNTVNDATCRPVDARGQLCASHGEPDADRRGALSSCGASR